MRIEWAAAVVPQRGDAIWTRDLMAPERGGPCPEECLVSVSPSALGTAARSCGAECGWGWAMIAIRSPLWSRPPRTRIQMPGWRYNLGGTRSRLMLRHHVPAHKIFHTRSAAFKSIRAATEAGDQERAGL